MILIIAKRFKLKKIYAGSYSNNIFSKSVKNGFFHEAIFKEKFKPNKKYIIIIFF